MKKITLILSLILAFFPVHATLTAEEKQAAEAFISDFMVLVVERRIDVDPSTLPNLDKRLQEKEFLLDKNSMPGLAGKQEVLMQILKMICRLTFIEKLTFIHFGLEELPADIQHLTKLQHLNLTGNHLSELPDELFFLTNLTELRLTYNKFKRLPRAITNLVNLKRLLMWDNPLEDNSQGNDWGKIMLAGYFGEALETGNKRAELERVQTEIEQLLGGSGDEWREKSLDKIHANMANLIGMMAGFDAKF